MGRQYAEFFVEGGLFIALIWLMFSNSQNVERVIKTGGETFMGTVQGLQGRPGGY